MVSFEAGLGMFSYKYSPSKRSPFFNEKEYSVSLLSVIVFELLVEQDVVQITIMKSKMNIFIEFEKSLRNRNFISNYFRSAK